MQSHPLQGKIEAPFSKLSHLPGASKWRNGPTTRPSGSSGLPTRASAKVPSAGLRRFSHDDERRP